MARKLIVFSDGTGNSAASTTKTNVWRVYEALDLTQADQLARFDDGVGNSALQLFRVLGLALGFGVKRTVLDMYKFLCRNYRLGDEIYAFGFSRGAFTIRVLNGLVCTVGLVPYVSDEHLDYAARSAYRHYRSYAFRGPWWTQAFRRLRDAGLCLIDYVAGREAEINARAKPLKPRTVRVKFLGLWDTVAAYGLPVDELTRAVDKWLWPLKFENTVLSDQVDWARHALALDDERRTFFPIPWSEATVRPPATGQSLHGERILQVWFAGVHANVGGGYPDDRLAHVALCWMIDEASRARDPSGALATSGLRFKQSVVDHYRAVASYDGTMYDSRAGLGTLYRYHPRSLSRLMHVADGSPRPLLHDSVVTRMVEGSDQYASVAIDTDVDLITEDNVALPFKIALAEDPQLSPRRLRAQRAINSCLSGSDRAERDACMSRGLDLVWWRRVLYYVSLGHVMLLAALPLYSNRLEELLCQVPWMLPEMINSLASFVLSPLFFVLRFATPAFVAPWIETYEAQPFVAAVLALVIAALYRTTGVLQQRIHDWTSAGWEHQRVVHLQELDQKQKKKQGPGLLYGITAILLLVGAGLVIQFFRPESSFLLCIRSLVVAIGAVLGILLALTLAVTTGLFALGFAWLGFKTLTRSRVRPRLQTDFAGDTGISPWKVLHLAHACRRCPFLIEAYNYIKFPVLPFIVIVSLATAVLWFPVVKLLYEGRTALGFVCKSGSTVPVTGELQGTFDISSECWASGWALEAGKKYSISVTMTPPEQEWFDKTTYADLAGFRSTDAFRRLLTITKRHWSLNWFTPVGRIGSRGSEWFGFTVTHNTPIQMKLSNDEQSRFDAIVGKDRNAKATLLPIHVETAQKGFTPHRAGTCSRGE